MLSPENASREPHPVLEFHALEALLDAFMFVAEPLLQPQHLLADDREAEMPGFDDAGVHRPDRNLVHAVAADLYEGIVVDAALDARLRGIIAPQRKRVRRPRGMPQPWALIAAIVADADEVEHRALHPVGAGEDAGQIGEARVLRRQRHIEPEERVLDHEQDVEGEAGNAIAVVRAPERCEPPAALLDGHAGGHQCRRRDRSAPRRHRARHLHQCQSRDLHPLLESFVTPFPIASADQPRQPPDTTWRGTEECRGRA